MRGNLTCADCGRRMQQRPQSLPQGVATCHECRRRKPRVTNYVPPSKRGTCATCGGAMFRGKGSAPDGKARCLKCRRESSQSRSTLPNAECVDCGCYFFSTATTPRCKPCRKARPRFGSCSACGARCYGNRCRMCADLAQRIRANDDVRVRRRMREMAAPGMNSTQRKALLARWKKQQRRCSYCLALATTIDHVVPLVRGGTNHEGNLAPSCRRCNSRKAGWLVIEWKSGKRLDPMKSVPRWQPREQAQRRACPGCGNPLPRKRCFTCQPANPGGHDGKQMTREQRRQRAISAAAMREAGWDWQTIALLFDYSSAASAHGAVKSYKSIATMRAA